jgi:hypothetical protein
VKLQLPREKKFTHYSFTVIRGAESIVYNIETEIEVIENEGSPTSCHVATINIDWCISTGKD